MDLNRKRKLIIVCGLPGSGKTTLAKKLSEKMGVACLHKDSIKESLYDIFEMKTLEDSKRLGTQSIKLLFKLTEEQLTQGVDLILEAPFNFPEDYKIFNEWQLKYRIDLYSVICSINSKTREGRISNRPRHKAHHDDERGDFLMNVKCNYKDIPGKQVRVITDKAVATLTNIVIAQLK